MEKMENLFRVDDIKVDMPSKVLSDNVAKIAVIGVGGGGCNMINHMINEGSHKIDLIAANTDLQVLHISKAPKKIQLGLKLTKGLGAGMKPEVGRDSAVESYEEIKATLKGADIIFIAAGLGGGTGTGAAAIIAKAAKEIGALTVSVVENTSEKPAMQHRKEEVQIKDNSTILTPLIRDKKKGVSKFWNKVSEWF